MNQPLILTTKLYPPPIRTDLIARPQLLKQLELSLHKKLTLLIAPAGFGKTTVVSNWLQSGDKEKKKFAWLSIDENDDDLERFLLYFLAAWQQIEPTLTEELIPLLSGTTTPSSQRIISLLINKMMRYEKELICVLDDYHLITQPTIHQAIEFFLDHAPAHVHIFLISRTTPPLPLSRLLVRGEMQEIKAPTLRFNQKEIKTFLNELMGFALSEEELMLLGTRTEGWPAGLQLAAHSLRSHENMHQFINEFTGSDRYVLDYLMDEVFSQQPEKVQTFLLQTAVLNKLNGPLCQALTGNPESQQMLEQLDQMNLFIVPLDNQRHWYRYHHLFAELLRHRLPSIFSSSNINRLHLRASEWYETEEMMDEAILHASRGYHHERAVFLIEQTANDTLWGQGSVTTLRRQIESLPDNVRRRHPHLQLFVAWSTLLAGDLEKTADTVALVQEIVKETAVSDQIVGELLSLQSYLARLDGDTEEALTIVQTALEKIPQKETNIRAMSYLNMLNCYEKLGEFKSMTDTALRAVTMAEQTDNLFIRLHTLRALANSYYLDARLIDAEQIYLEALHLGKAPELAELPILGLAHTGLGNIYYEWNDLKKATYHYQQGIQFGEQSDIVDVLLAGYIGQVRLARIEEDIETAQLGLKKLEILGERLKVAYMENQIAAFTAFTNFRLGNIQVANDWLKRFQISPKDHPPRAEFNLYTVYCRLRIFQSWKEKNDTVLDGISDLLQYMVEQQESPHHKLRLLLIQAVAYYLQGDEKAAIERLIESLKLGEENLYTRTYLDEGALFTELLEKAYQQKKNLPFLKRLRSKTTQSPSLSSTEELTSREQEVLDLIIAGHSNQEISDTLFISINTVRTHIKNIYSKLGVESRTQAIAKVRPLL